MHGWVDEIFEPSQFWCNSKTGVVKDIPHRFALSLVLNAIVDLLTPPSSTLHNPTPHFKRQWSGVCVFALDLRVNGLWKGRSANR